MAKVPVGSLNAISDAIQMSAKQNEEERLTHEKQMGEPFFFIPDEYSEGHGIGFFKLSPDHIVGYRRFSNGYEKFPCVQYDRGLIDKIHEEFSKE